MVQHYKRFNSNLWHASPRGHGGPRMYLCSAHEACNVELTQWYRIDGFTLLPFSSLQMQVTLSVYVDSFMGDETNKST